MEIIFTLFLLTYGDTRESSRSGELEIIKKEIISCKETVMLRRGEGRKVNLVPRFLTVKWKGELTFPQYSTCLVPSRALALKHPLPLRKVCGGGRYSTSMSEIWVRDKKEVKQEGLVLSTERTM